MEEKLFEFMYGWHTTPKEARITMLDVSWVGLITAIGHTEN